MFGKNVRESSQHVFPSIRVSEEGENGEKERTGERKAQILHCVGCRGIVFQLLSRNILQSSMPFQADSRQLCSRPFFETDRGSTTIHFYSSETSNTFPAEARQAVLPTTETHFTLIALFLFSVISVIFLKYEGIK